MTHTRRSGGASDLFAYTPMLDETLLHLAVLDRHAGIGPMHAWRARCVALMSDLEGEVLARTVTPDQARSLRLSHARLLDDATLAASPESMRKAWEGATLCQVELGEADGAGAVLADIGAVLQSRPGAAGWLHWYACLFAAGLLRRRPDAAECRRQVGEQLRKVRPQASDEAYASE